MLGFEVHQQYLEKMDRTKENDFLSNNKNIFQPEIEHRIW